MHESFSQYSTGLRTREALDGLRDIIQSHQNAMPSKWNDINDMNFWRNVFHHNNYHSFFCWVPVVVFAVLGSIFFILSMWVEGTILLFLIIFNAALVSWDSYLRRRELNNKLTYVLQKLKCVCEACDWSEEFFPHPCTPNSPSVSLQWTIRDGKIVNLPTVLLTAGDLIVMRPGQQSPVDCCTAQNTQNARNEDSNSLMTDEVFSCHGSLYKLEQPSSPTIRHPLPNKVYKVVTPPIVKHLSTLRSKFLNRPVSLYNRARHLLFNKFLLQYLLPVNIVIAELLAVIRWVFVPHLHESWLHFFLVEPAAVIISLIPLTFPLVWFLVSTFGNALLLSCSIRRFETDEVFFNTESVEAQVKKSEIKFCWKIMVNLAFDIIIGKGSSIIRSSNLLHTLASVTGLCCVDKKGILSWPNPTAEKLFILKDLRETSAVSELHQNLTPEDSDKFENIQNNVNENSNEVELPICAEVLDLTHDSLSAWKLQFDDVRWRKHLPSLKPLGLAVLLNTCNPRTHKQYSQFCAHITCQSLFTEHLVPVTNRRCLCELSRLIGFKESTEGEYNLELQLSTYKNVGDIIEMDTRYMKTFFKRRKLKFPFPHMVSVCVDTNQNDLETNEDYHTEQHLFSQGTADIILDCCIDCWTGSNIVRLTQGIRNKILEFYQRSSLSAYCTAFSYRPIFRKVDKSLSGVYIELPRDIKGLSSSSSHSSSSPTSFHGSAAVDTEMDVILEEVPEIVTDATDCFRAQCNQVFIGMVSMQYQALSDMVQLIEELEKACIRFVHFSKENELRSRFFSEKMGIESGWNCHISLLGDYNSDEDSPFNANPDSGGNSTTGHEKQRKSVDQSSESEISYNAEENEPLGFDMSNRSKLPRGIENIRPHLQEVDNVPLLVSLFTDCTPEATQEMVSIMQENGEVVCVIGSSANIHNTGNFVQADASIALDPLYPQVCQREPVIKEFSEKNYPMTPIQLSQLLNSIACCLMLRREDPLPIYHLILQARHIMQHVWNCVQFWLCCIAVLTVVQLLAMVLMLPAIFTIEQVLWISCIAIPLFSISLLTGPADEEIMNKATGKDWLCSPNAEIVLYLLWCYGAKLLMAIFSTLILYIAMLYTLCHQFSNSIPRNISKPVQCSYVYPTDELKSSPVVLEEYFHILFLARQSVAFILILHYTALCASFLHRECVCWKRVPCLNVTWALLVLSVLVVQFLYIIDYELYTEHIARVSIPTYLIIYSLMSPLLTFFICESIKLQEIRVNKRYHRKVRLMFGTKLGMNSPF